MYCFYLGIEARIEQILQYRIQMVNGKFQQFSEAKLVYLITLIFVDVEELTQERESS